MKIPRVLIIGGSDPSGGAGVQADSFTVAHFGAFPCPIITAVTAQNSSGVISFHSLPPEMVGEQIEAVLDDGRVAAVKTGMIPSEEVLDIILDSIRSLDVPLVVDPVMAASDGTSLFTGSISRFMNLATSATILTPNIKEAERLTGRAITGESGMEEAANLLLESGVARVLIKGGHLGGDDAADLLSGAQESLWLRERRLTGGDVRGTGCMLASAIAASLANGIDLHSAVVEAKKFVTSAIEKAVRLGKGSRQALFTSELF